MTTKTNKGNLCAKVLATMVLFMMGGAEASPSVKIDSVMQRWPWNNKLDITYTVNDGQKVSDGVFYRLEFKAIINGNTYVIDGMSTVGASANTGTHTVTWTIPSGHKADNCTMVASIHTADMASGDDYMVIDLSTGKVAYEGLLATQNASDVRYNADAFKNEKLVLRKVPAGGVYPTGHNDFAGRNSPRTWTTDRDYYIGIFPVTQAQYIRICGTNPSSWAGDNFSAVTITNRPVQAMTWEQLRGVAVKPSDTVGSNRNGSFFERLNALTGMGGFDLPTEVMAEIAQRAGETGVFSWGDKEVDVKDYAIGSANNSHQSSSGHHMPVGLGLPNNWGLFDTSGNCWEYCRDDATLDDLADSIDPWTPASGGSNLVRRHGGGHCRDSLFTSNGKPSNVLRASERSTQDKTKAAWGIGFRVSRIMQ